VADPIALWVVPVADWGGVARHVCDAAKTGIPGWRVIVLCPEGALAERLREQGSAVLTDQFGTQAGLAASIKTLKRTVGSLRPAVVHTHLAYADLVGALALPPWRSRRPRLFSTEHGIAPDDRVYHGTRAKSALMASAHRLRCRTFDGLIAVSASTRQVMMDKWRPRTPIAVIHNAVDLPVKGPRRAPGLRLLSLSRLAPEKGLHSVLDAFALIHEEHPEARLTLAGTGPLANELRQHARSLGLEDAASFPGFVDPVRVLGDHDVLVQLSVWENCSYTILDALASGLGVVATPVGGNPELLPARCLVQADDPVSVAAATVAQGTDTSVRPGLPESSTTLAGMCRRIASLYESTP